MKKTPSAERMALAVLGALTVLAPRAAAACMCEGTVLPPCAELYVATAVFVGKVIKEGHGKTTFAVKKRLAGKQLGATVDILFYSDCSMKFDVGGEYVVYAYDDKEAGGLVVSQCGRTGGGGWGSEGAGEEDIQYARSPPKRKLAKIDGRVNVVGQTSQPLPGATVHVVGTGLVAVSDDNGQFTLDVPPRKRQYEFTVEAKGMHQRYFEVAFVPVAAACAQPKLLMTVDAPTDH